MMFKGFYHIWAWWPSWSVDRYHFNNLSFPCPKEAPHEIWATLAQRLQRRSHLKFSTFFQYKCMGPIQMQREANDLAVKRSMYDQHFSNLGRSPIPNNLCKVLAPRHPRFWIRRLLKVFTIYEHGGHLSPWTTIILAIFHSPAPKRLHMKFEQHWQEASEEKLFEILNIFPYKCIGAHTNT